MRALWLILFLPLLPLCMDTEEPVVEIEEEMIEKRNIWVTTDIGGSDPDDIQSLVHLLQYSDKLNIKGITVGYPRGDIEVAKEVKAAYKKDYQTYEGFSEHIRPQAIRLREGQQSAGDWSRNRASRALVRESNKEEYSRKNPLIILSWGACTDVAAAIENGLNPRNVIIYFVAGFSSTDWNALQDRESFDRVVRARRYKRIMAGSTIRGIYYGWNLESNRKYVRRRIEPYGALGKLFFEKSARINTGSYSIKMGDTPSVLWALSSKELDPEKRSWGGRFINIGPNMWGVYPGKSIGIFEGARTIRRKKFLSDWRKQIRRIYE